MASAAAVTGDASHDARDGSARQGASGDARDYSLEREYEDAAAVVDAVAAASGRHVDVYGHSLGALVAFGAATLTTKLRRLVLYEGWPVPDPSVYALSTETMERMNQLLAQGDPGGVVETLFGAVEHVTDEDMAALRSAPSWPGRVAAAKQVPREIVAASSARLARAEAATITAPVLLVTGQDSTDPAKAEVEAVAEVLPDARLLVLAGQQHIGDILDPQTFAAHLLTFVHHVP